MINKYSMNAGDDEQPIFISLPCGGNSKEIKIVSATHVLYVESKGDHICCIAAMDEMNNGRFIKSVMNKDIGHFCNLLPRRLFIQIHKSFLVNINFIKAYNKTDYVITMADKTTFNVAYRRQKEFRNIINL